jgi:dipeptidase E
MRLLLLSNSTNHGGTFLGHAEDMLAAFLGKDVKRILFVPYAAVRFSFDDFATKVAERFGPLGYEVDSVHRAADPRAAVEAAEAVVVGGGNTFQLLARIYQDRLLGPIRDRVSAGAPYIGWSAGSNVACPSIKTTNDMPIVEPPSFLALGLVPFQINPHFTDASIPNHGGETRSERLLEFVAANPDIPVIGLREGSTLRVENGRTTLLGDHPAIVFHSGSAPRDVAPGVVTLS